MTTKAREMVRLRSVLDPLRVAADAALDLGSRKARIRIVAPGDFV
jgi:hypothetical protein